MEPIKDYDARLVEPPNDGGAYERWLDDNRAELQAYFRENYLAQYNLEPEAWSLADNLRFRDFCEAEYQRELDRRIL